jgi:hypothetical protein
LPDPFDDAWVEASTTAPDKNLFNTLEVYHQTWPEPLRIVNNADGIGDTINLGIELGATFDPGDMVPFTKVAFYAPLSEVSVGIVPECTITIDNVERILMEDLDAATLISGNIILIYRVYHIDDLTEPKYGPVEYIAQLVKARTGSLSMKAKIDNMSNRKFPTQVYTVSEFPGLLSG